MSLVTPRKGYKSVPWLFGKEIEIPQEWKLKKLKESCTVRQGLQIPISDRFTEDGKNRFQYITVKAIHSNKFNEYVENPSERVICTTEDILFTRTGNTGEIITDIKGVFHNNFFLVDFDKRQLFKEFLIISLKQHKIQGMIKSLAGTTTIPDLNHGDFFRLQIIIPPLPEQQKIASILSNVDNLIESTGKVITHSKKVKTGLMQKLLTRGIGHTKFKKVPWLFGKEIEIPEEWEINTFDDMFEFLISGTNARIDLNDSGEIRYIHYGDIHTKWSTRLDCDLDEIPRIDEEKVSRLQLLKEGDLIIADASEDVEGSGTSISLKNVKNKKIVAGLHTLVLRRKDENASFGFMRYLTSISYVKIQIISWVTGAKVFGLTKASSRKIKVPLPTFLEQQKIATILSNIDDKITSQEQYKEKLEKLKKSLMQKLLTGEVRV